MLFCLPFSLLLSCNSTIPQNPSNNDRAYRIILVEIGEYQYIDDIGSGIPPQEFVDSILDQWKFGKQQKSFDMMYPISFLVGMVDLKMENPICVLMIICLPILTLGLQQVN